MSKKVSIVIPVYNAEKYLETCLKSILNQTYENFEIILVNDGSKDKSVNICSSYCEKYSNIIVINQENMGPAKARSNGVRAATGDYICFIDSDDYIDRNVIEILVNEFQDNVLGAVKIKYDTNGKIYEKKDISEEYNSVEYVEKFLDGKVLGVSVGILFEKDKIEEEFFDTNTNYMEDSIFVINYIQENNIKKFKYINGAYYYYVQNNSSITQSNKNIMIKLEKINYSLENSITEYKYKEKVSNKKIRILEEFLRLITNGKDLESAFSIYSIEKYTCKNLRYKVFSFLYRKRKKGLLLTYYKVRKFAKRIVNSIKN